ncbi:hypothetical protein D3C86_2263120 [compost metagenome]
MQNAVLYQRLQNDPGNGQRSQLRFADMDLIMEQAFITARLQLQILAYMLQFLG